MPQQQPQRAPYSGYQANPSQVPSNAYAQPNVAPVQQTQPMQYQQPPQQPAQPQPPTQYQAPPQSDMNGQAPPMNTLNAQPQQVQQVQQQQQPLVAQPRRAPMKASGSGLYEQFTNPAPAMQQQAPPRSMQPVQPQAVPQQAVPTQQVPAAQQQEEKAAVETTTAGGAAQSGSPKKPAAAAPARREPPWKPFTGEKQNPISRLYGWAHRVRQVVSPDTLRIALLKARDAADPLLPPKVITITLDGIEVPRIQRYLPPGNDRRDNRRQPKKKAASDEAAEDGAVEDDSKSPRQNTGPATIDDPYAYDAREFIRSRVMNKNIFYAVWKVNRNQNQQGGQGGAEDDGRATRMWGDIYYQDENRNTRSLTQELVAAGYATVKQNTNRHDLSPTEKEKLEKKEKAAREAGRGIHNKDAKKGERTIRNIEWLAQQKQTAFGQQFKGKTLPGVVDGVISGSSLRMELCVDTKKRIFKTVVVNLAGVNCPRVPLPENRRSNYKGQRRERDKKRVQIERDYGAKAKEWTEERLLGQRVNVNIMFVSSNQIIAQVLSEKGRIGPSLLKKGLAEYQEWSASKCDDQEKALLKASCEMAIKARLNIWKTLDQPSSSKRTELQVTVVQVVSGDTVQVRYDRDVPPESVTKSATKKGEFFEERISLSSIRTPRLGVRGAAADAIRQRNQRQKKDEKGNQRTQMRYSDPTLDEYLARDARELVRKMTIGRQVTLITEYTRGIPQGGQGGGKPRMMNKKFGSILVTDAKGNSQNVALELIKKGFAELVWHGKDESDRSSAYLELQDAYEKAAKAKIGLNAYVKNDKQRNMVVPDIGKREAEARKNRVVDLSGGGSDANDTARQFQINQFLRSGPCKGIVEFVFGGSRVKIFIPGNKKGKKPRPDVCIAVRLADIRVGGYAVDPKSDPLREQARQYLTDTILQREVTLKITSTGDSNQGRGGRNRRNNRNKNQGGGQAVSQPPRNPNLDGHISLGGVNVAQYLLENGLATVITRRGGYEETPKGDTIDFAAYEQVAKSAEKGCWKDFQEQDESKQNRQRELRSRTGQVVEVLVSHVDSATQFYVNQAEDQLEDKDKLMKRVLDGMEALRKSRPGPPQGRIAKDKQTLCALFMGHYARCRVLKKDVPQQTQQQAAPEQKDAGKGKGKKGKGKAKAAAPVVKKEEGQEFFFVRFYDYGNVCRVARKDFAELPLDMRVAAIPPLAKRCELAGIKPGDVRSGWFNEGGRQFSEWTVDAAQKLKMRILYDDQQNDTWCVDLLYKAEDGSDQSINAALARQGLVLQQAPRERPYAFKSQTEWGTPWPKEHKENVDAYFAALTSNIKLAKLDHLALFAYGDMEDDEDDLLGPRPGQEGKKLRR